MKKKPPFNVEMAIRGANRRLFARSPLVLEKLNESRQEFPRYKKDGTLAKKPWVKRQCEVCFEWVSTNSITIDHKDPVVPPSGFPINSDLWERHIIFMKRLWCDKSNLQRICDRCHNQKTYSERITRLLKQYNKELDMFENEIMQGLLRPNWKKELARYIAKKKTSGLEIIVQRAIGIRDSIREQFNIK